VDIGDIGHGYYGTWKKQRELISGYPSNIGKRVQDISPNPIEINK